MYSGSDLDCSNDSEKLLVEQLLSVLRDIPDDRSNDEQELPLHIESDDDELIPVPSSSDSDDDDAQEPLGVFSNTSFYYFIVTFLITKLCVRS